MTFEELEQKLNTIESLVKTLVGEQKDEKEKAEPPSKPPTYYTRQQVSELLSISFPTLNRYSQLGIIPSLKVGNRVLYKLEDLQDALKKVPTIRTARGQTFSTNNSHD
jgi:excisionase family DNA binding protein